MYIYIHMYICTHIQTLEKHSDHSKEKTLNSGSHIMKALAHMSRGPDFFYQALSPLNKDPTQTLHLDDHVAPISPLSSHKKLHKADY